MLDANGKVRVKIAMDCSVPKDWWPGIDLYGPSGKPLTVVGAGVLEVSGDKSNTTILDNGIQVEGVTKEGGARDIANLGVGMVGLGAGLSLSGKGATSVLLEGQSGLPGGEGGVLDLMGKDNNSVYLDSDSPSIEVAKGNGSFMELGSTSLANSRTGATEQTSAASIVMFSNDKKHHVIWQAP